MTKSLSIASVIEKNRIASDVPWLVCVDVGVINPTTGELVETGHFVRNTEDVVFNGSTYLASAFDIELKEESGTQQTVNLSFKDYTLTIQRKMQAYGGGVGFTIAIMVVNAAALTQPAEIIENFEVIGASSANYDCSFVLGAENGITKAFPRRRQTKDYCQWRYKSVECGYGGGLASCDLSLKGANGCAVHNNVIHFGAYPGINTRDINYG